MAIWKLEPVNPDEHYWQESTYVGYVIVRARDEAGARGYRGGFSGLQQLGSASTTASTSG